MNFALFGRFFLEFAMMYPAEYLCLASLQEHLRAPIASGIEAERHLVHMVQS